MKPVYRAFVSGWVAVVAWAGGCAGGPADVKDRARVVRPAHDRIVAVVAGSAVTHADLADALVEGSGGVALEDLALDLVLVRELERAGVVIASEDVARERAAFIDAIGTREGGTDEAERLLAEVRRSRGLGPKRFERLLWRNAGLRALVRGRVEITDEMLARRYEVKYGELFVARLITTRRLEEAESIRQELLAGDMSDRAVRFAQVAMERSTDPSAPAGGTIEPFSAADPAYPAGVRRALSELAVGEVSNVVAIENGHAILFLERKIAPRNVRLEEVRASLEAELRQRQERILMDELALGMLAQADISVLDPSLAWAWAAFSSRDR